MTQRAGVRTEESTEDKVRLASVTEQQRVKRGQQRDLGRGVRPRRQGLALAPGRSVDLRRNSLTNEGRNGWAFLVPRQIRRGGRLQLLPQPTGPLCFDRVPNAGVG